VGKFVVALIAPIVISASFAQTTAKPASKQQVHAAAKVDPQSIISEDVKRHLTAVFDPHDTMSEVKEYVAQTRTELKTDADKSALLNIEKALDLVEEFEKTEKEIGETQDTIRVIESHIRQFKHESDNPPYSNPSQIMGLIEAKSFEVELEPGFKLGTTLSDDANLELRLEIELKHSEGERISENEMQRQQDNCTAAVRSVAKKETWTRQVTKDKCSVATSNLIEAIKKDYRDKEDFIKRKYRTEIDTQVARTQGALSESQSTLIGLTAKRAAERARASELFAFVRIALGITGTRDPFLDRQSEVEKAN
jgi:hypothetical protein